MFNINKLKIGFAVENPEEYNTAMASTRLRVYDIVDFLNKNSHIKAELYNQNQHYDIVIFQKFFTKEAAILAEKLKSANTITVLDINVNYTEAEEVPDIMNLEQQRRIVVDMNQMLRNVDYVLTSSPKLKEIYSQYHNKVFCIEENVTNNFFKVKKIHEDKSQVKLLYSGYAVKAKEIYLIEDVLLELNKKFKISLIFLSEKDPKINLLPYEFIKYDQKILPNLLIKGDIKIAPRDLNLKYNLGHSFNKVAYPMSVGLPAVASPVPSYINREVLICNNNESWYRTLNSLIGNYKFREFYGVKGRSYVINNFSQERIGQEYISFFNLIR